MTKFRVGVLVFLFALPWAFLVGVGSYHLWATGWLSYAWIPMFVCFALSYFFAWRWTRGRGMLPDTAAAPPNYWTDRDKLAWDKVQAKAKGYEKITPTLLADPRHYSELSLDLAEQVAAVYSPGGAHPFDHLTIPEVLACVELAAADLDELTQKYIPGVHMLRIRDYQQARKAVDWYKTGQNIYWGAAAIFNPVEVGVRWAASRFALGGILDKLQDNVLLWFHTAFIHQFGRHLIEMNSGRLKVGAKRYREILKNHQEPPAEPAPASPADPAAPPPPAAPGARPIGIAVLGPVKAGKSSLVNALLGKQAATVDTLPVAHIGVRYNLTLAGGQPVTVLDTAGYGQDGANEAEFAAAAEAAKEAEIILFVTQATNPGRRADVDLLDRLKAWFDARPHLKLPPIVAVVNQIDLLSPKAEWAPPYDWQTGTRPKEVNIRDCAAAVREQLGNRVIEIVPACARQGETFGISEGLVPVIALQLDDARGAAVLKAFDAEAAADQYRRVGKQLLAGGRSMLGILWENLKKN